MLLTKATRKCPSLGHHLTAPVAPPAPPPRPALPGLALWVCLRLPHLYGPCWDISMCPGLAGVVLGGAGGEGLVSAAAHHPSPAPQGPTERVCGLQGRGLPETSHPCWALIPTIIILTEHQLRARPWANAFISRRPCEQDTGSSYGFCDLRVTRGICCLDTQRLGFGDAETSRQL